MIQYIIYQRKGELCMWTYEQPVKILFGEKRIENLAELIMRNE